MGNESVEIELLKYLREEHADKAARKERDADARRALEHVANQLTVLDKKFDVQAAQNDARFRGIEARMTAVEADAEVTGNFRVDDLKAKLEEAKERAEQLEEAHQNDGAWWRRQWVQWLGAAVLMVMSGCGGAASTLALSKFIGGH